MRVKVENGVLIMELPLQSPRPSKSGKALIVASTAGFQKSGVELQGKEISVSVNAIVPKG